MSLYGDSGIIILSDSDDEDETPQINNHTSDIQKQQQQPQPPQQQQIPLDIPSASVSPTSTPPTQGNGPSILHSRPTSMTSNSIQQPAPKRLRLDSLNSTKRIGRLDSLNTTRRSNNNAPSLFVNRNQTPSVVLLTSSNSDTPANGSSRSTTQSVTPLTLGINTRVPPTATGSRDRVEVISLSSDDEDGNDLSFNQSFVDTPPSHVISPDNANDADGDDELMILSPDIAKVGKFKPSSFEQRGYQEIQYPQQHQQQQPYQWGDFSYATDASGQQQQTYNNPRLANGLYNQPAPVPHADQNLNLIRQQEFLNRQSRMAQDIFKLQQDKRTLQQKLQSIKTTIDNYKNQLITHKRKLSEAVRTGDEHTRLATRRLVEFLMSGISKLQSSIPSYATKIQAINSHLTHLGRMGALPPGVNPVDLTTTIAYEQPPIQPVIQQPIGYQSNIYADDSDIRNLMDNIKPPEDLIEGMESTPEELNISLLKHQRIGVAWMKRMEDSRHHGGILADDMGLGKTVQTIALMMAHKPLDELECKTTLIVGPVSLLRQWAAEIESKIKPTYPLHVGIYHGLERKSMSSYESLREYDVLLTSYHTLSNEWKRHFAEELAELKASKDPNLPDSNSGGRSYDSPFYGNNSRFYRIVLDEAQAIKNRNAFASKAVIYLKAKYRFCLSGTPMQNNVEELYPIIRFLQIKPYNNLQKFRADIIVPLKSKSGNYDKRDQNDSMRKLRAILSAILLRRTKTSEIDGKPILELPEKVLHSDFVEMDEQEMKFYKELETGIQKKAEKMLDERKMTGVLVLLLRLRQACCHQYLVEIGEMKAAQRSNNENLLNDWKKMYYMNTCLEEKVLLNVKRLTSSSLLPAPGADVKLDESDNEEMLTCPVCFDVLSEDSSMVLFAECGHLICQSCIEAFFEKNTADEDNSGNRIATCSECNTPVKETNLIDYIIFKKTHQENLPEQEVKRFCEQYYNTSNKKDNLAIIHDLVRRDEGFTPSAKMEKAIELIKNVFLTKPGEKIIIFSQFVTLFDLMKLVLRREKIDFLRYDGSMNMDHKNTVIKQFYQTDTKVLLLSLRSGNVGLTLTCASHVIIMDPFWNPYVEEQAMDRAHRIGQQREVNVHRILISGTVEKRIMELQDLKKELVESALNEKEMKSVSRLGQRELGFLFGLNDLRAP